MLVPGHVAELPGVAPARRAGGPPSRTVTRVPGLAEPHRQRHAQHSPTDDPPMRRRGRDMPPELALASSHRWGPYPIVGRHGIGSDAGAKCSTRRSRMREAAPPLP